MVASNVALVSGSTEGAQEEYGGLQRQSFSGDADSAFRSSNAPVAPESPVTCEQGQLDIHHFPRGPNDPSRKTLTVIVLPATLALMLETGLSRPEELFKYYAIKKQTICPLFLCLLAFKTLRHQDQLCKLSSAVVCTRNSMLENQRLASGRGIEGLSMGCGFPRGPTPLREQL